MCLLSGGDGTPQTDTPEPTMTAALPYTETSIAYYRRKSDAEIRGYIVATAGHFALGMMSDSKRAMTLAACAVAINRARHATDETAGRYDYQRTAEIARRVKAMIA